MNDPIVTLSAVNVSLEGGALRLFEETSKLGERVGDQLLQRCYDYNWADEVTHAMIGDYFVRALALDDPDAERRAHFDSEGAADTTGAVRRATASAGGSA